VAAGKLITFVFLGNLRANPYFAKMLLVVKRLIGFRPTSKAQVRLIVNIAMDLAGLGMYLSIPLSPGLNQYFA